MPKQEASAIEDLHLSNDVANSDIPTRSVLLKLASEMNRNAPLVAAKISDKSRPKLPQRVQEYFNLPARYTRSSDSKD